jgi:hypothetical protein
MYLSCSEDVNAAVAGSLLQTLPLLHHNERRDEPRKRISDARFFVALKVQHAGHAAPQWSGDVSLHVLSEIR